MDRSFFMNFSLVVHRRVYFIITDEDRLIRDGRVIIPPSSLSIQFYLLVPPELVL